MKISYNWLKNYINISKTPEETAVILTDIGLEVEGVENYEGVKGGLEGVCIGKVLEVEKHPNADKLKLTKVDVGSEILDIVCGAPNVAKDQFVLVATVGSTIYPLNSKEGLKIKEANIRGEKSCGMICAEDELGLGESHDGIMVLENAPKVGTKAKDYFGFKNDSIFEIGLTPNRSDAISHIGVARDLMAYLNYNGDEQQLKWPVTTEIPLGKDDRVQIQIEDTEACPKYMGLLIDDIKVGESPEWLKQNLLAIGSAPINNVVDITNFVLHECGQPLHAFDAGVVNGQVIVRKAKKEEKFISLDGVERKLHEEDLMICNANEAMCIGGVFGGQKSGVSEKTVSVFLESAWFNPVSVRKTSKRHGLHTDASFRFEREVDPNITQYAMQRAADLIKEICGGKVKGQIVLKGNDKTDFHYIDFSPKMAKSLIGSEIRDDEFKKVFEALEMKVDAGKDSWKIEVPPYRADVRRQADLVEEFLRIYGYNNITDSEKFSFSIGNFDENREHQMRNAVSEFLTAGGFNEAMNNSLGSFNSLNGRFNEEQAVKILNPLSKELDVLRQSLLFGLLDNIVYNQNRQSPNLKFFEFGNMYQKTNDSYKETKILALAVTGLKHQENWQGKDEKVSIYTLKSYVEGIMNKAGLNFTCKGSTDGLLKDSLSYFLGKDKLCEMGEIPLSILKQTDIKQAVFYAEIYWGKLMQFYSPKIKFKAISVFPAVRRDLSLLIDEQVSFEMIREIAGKTEKNLLKQINLFDVYQGDKIEKRKKSYAVSFIFQDEQKTLTDERIDHIMGKIIQELREKTGAELR